MNSIGNSRLFLPAPSHSQSPTPHSPPAPAWQQGAPGVKAHCAVTQEETAFLSEWLRDHPILTPRRETRAESSSPEILWFGTTYGAGGRGQSV